MDVVIQCQIQTEFDPLKYVPFHVKKKKKTYTGEMKDDLKVSMVSRKSNHFKVCSSSVRGVYSRLIWFNVCKILSYKTA